jgi:hypothetical protein
VGVVADEIVPAGAAAPALAAAAGVPYGVAVAAAENALGRVHFRAGQRASRAGSSASVSGDDRDGTGISERDIGGSDADDEGFLLDEDDDDDDGDGSRSAFSRSSSAWDLRSTAGAPPSSVGWSSAAGDAATAAPKRLIPRGSTATAGGVGAGGAAGMHSRSSSPRSTGTDMQPGGGGGTAHTRAGSGRGRKAAGLGQAAGSPSASPRASILKRGAGGTAVGGSVTLGVAGHAAPPDTATSRARGSRHRQRSRSRGSLWSRVSEGDLDSFDAGSLTDAVLAMQRDRAGGGTSDEDGGEGEGAGSGGEGVPGRGLPRLGSFHWSDGMGPYSDGEGAPRSWGREVAVIGSAAAAATAVALPSPVVASSAGGGLGGVRPGRQQARHDDSGLAAVARALGTGAAGGGAPVSAASAGGDAGAGIILGAAQSSRRRASGRERRATASLAAPAVSTAATAVLAVHGLPTSAALSSDARSGRAKVAVTGKTKRGLAAGALGAGAGSTRGVRPQGAAPAAAIADRAAGGGVSFPFVLLAGRPAPVPLLPLMGADNGDATALLH